MRGLVYNHPGDVSVEDLLPASLGVRDVRMDVEACGVCGSDLASFAHGHYVEPGQVMGHEIAAVVSEVGAELGDRLRAGQRVAVRPMRSCGRCGYCRAGDTHLCGHTYGPSLGYGVRGGFAEQLVMTDAVPGLDLIPVPDEVDPFDLLWAEPLAVAFHAVRQAGSDVAQLLITGAGAVGLAVTAAAIADGITVDVVEPQPERRDAAHRLGAGAFAPGDVPHGNRYDAVVDASGVPDAVMAGLHLLKPGAPVVLVGLGDQSVPWPLGDHPLVGAFAYRDDEFARAVASIASGAVRLGELVTHRFDLADGARALSPPAPGDGLVKAALVPRHVLQ